MVKESYPTPESPARLRYAATFFGLNGRGDSRFVQYARPISAGFFPGGLRSFGTGRVLGALVTA